MKKDPECTVMVPQPWLRHHASGSHVPFRTAVQLRLDFLVVDDLPMPRCSPD
jgi:hypothetical protein